MQCGAVCVTSLLKIEFVVKYLKLVVKMFAGMGSSAQLAGEVTPGPLTPSTSRRTLSGLFITPRQSSGLVNLVRDVRRKSLRRRKLWMNNDTDIVSLDQNKNLGFLTPARRFGSPKSFVKKNKCDAGLGLGSYKKLSSPVFPEIQQIASPQTPDTSFTRSVSEKENVDPIKAEKKQRRSSLFTPTSIRLRYLTKNIILSIHDDDNSSISRQSSVKSEVFGEGRRIPVKEGHLLKKSSHWKSCDWTSKYVSLSRDGALTCYPSYSGYRDETGAKSIDLRTATVKPFVDDTCEEKLLAGKTVFEVRTLDQHRWIFSCKSEEDRASWMTSIKAEIKNSLQVCQSAF